MHNQDRISNTTVLGLMHQIGQGMIYLQENRILHLDLEASSIYLISEQHATIGNFRLAIDIDYWRERFSCQFRES